jgi:arabinose-5-phosphate isomerase
VAILDESRHPLGVFTDGDLRRNLSEDSKSLMSKTFNEMQLKAPFTIQADALVFEAISIFKKKEFDNLVVLNEDGTYRGILDIQDLIRQNLIV